MTIKEPFIPGILFEFFSKCTIYKKYKRNAKIHSIVTFWTVALLFYIFKMIEYTYYNNEQSFLKLIGIEATFLFTIVGITIEFKPEKSFEIIMIDKILDRLSNIIIGVCFIKSYSLDREHKDGETDTLYEVLNTETTQLESLISTLLSNSNNIEFKDEYKYLIKNKKFGLDLLNTNILELLTKLQNFDYHEDLEHSNIPYYINKFLENTDNYITNVYYNLRFGMSDHWIWYDKLGVRHIRFVEKRKWLRNKLDGVVSKNKIKKSKNSLEWIDKI